MKYVKRFLGFWYHFIVGDDWRVAVAVILGLSLITYLVHTLHAQVWWLMPAMVVAMLSLSLLLAVRRK